MDLKVWKTHTNGTLFELFHFDYYDGLKERKRNEAESKENEKDEDGEKARALHASLFENNG